MKTYQSLFASIVFSFISLNGLAQTEKDTLNLLFQESDSLCTVGTYEVSQPNPKVKKYRKVVDKSPSGRLKEITFYICDEIFTYDHGSIDTLALASVKPSFISVQQAEDRQEKVAWQKVKQAGRSGTIQVITKGHFSNVFIYEKLQDDRYARYKVTWIDHIE